MSNYEPVTTGTRECISCHRNLHVLCFSADKRTKDGINHQCRECTSEKGRSEPKRVKLRAQTAEKKLKELKNRSFGKVE